MKCDHANMKTMTNTCDEEQTYSFLSTLEENSTPDPFIPTEEMPLHPNLQTSKAFKLSKPF